MTLFLWNFYERVATTHGSERAPANRDGLVSLEALAKLGNVALEAVLKFDKT